MRLAVTYKSRAQNLSCPWLMMVLKIFIIVPKLYVDTRMGGLCVNVYDIITISTDILIVLNQTMPHAILRKKTSGLIIRAILFLPV